MKSVSAVRATLLTLAIAAGLAGCEGEEEMSQEEIQYLSHLDQSRFFQRQGELKASTLEARSAIELEPEQPEPYFVIIDNLLQAGDAVNAERQLNRLMENVEQDNLSASAANKANLIRAEARLMQTQLDEALDALDQIESPDRPMEAQSALLRGKIHLAAQRFDQAEEAYEKARSADSSSALPLVGLSRVAWARGNQEKARDFIQQAEQIDRENPQLWLWKAQFAHAGERWEEAETAYIRALEDIGQYDVMTYQKYETISALIRVLREQGKASEAFVYEEILAKSAPGTIKSNLTAARDAFEEGNFDEAARHLEEVLAQAPSHEQSALMLGMVRFRQGRIEEAEKLLEPLVEMGDSEAASKLLAATRIQMRDPQGAQKVLENLDGQESDPETLALVGVASLASGDQETGEALIEKSLELNPENHPLSMRYAAYLTQVGKHDRAIKQARKVIQQAPELDQARAILIQAQLASGDRDAAVATASEWVKLQPDNESALISRGNLAARADNMEEAKQFFTQARDKAPNSARPLVSLGSLALSQGNEEQAEQHFREAVRLAPDSRSALQGLASLMEKEEITAYMRDLVEEQPEAIGPRLMLLEVALVDGRSQEASELTASLLEREQENTPSRAQPLVAGIYHGVATRLAQAGNTEQSAEILERGRVLFPEDENIALQAATVAFGTGSPAQAREILQEAKQQHPDSPRPYLVEASYFERQGEHQQAADLYQLALDKAPSAENAVAHARALQRAGRREEALKSLESATAKYPDNAQVLLHLALLQQAMGEQDSAREHYEKLLTIAPDNALVLNNLAWLYHEQGNDQAMELAQRAYELSPENAAIADTYGWIMFKSGNYEKSVPVLEKAHELEPESEEIALHLAEAYRASGKNSEAQKILEKFGGQG